MPRLQALCCGRLTFDRSLFFPDESPGVQTTVPVPGYLVIHPKGKLLFDTGIACNAASDPAGLLGERIARLYRLTGGDRPLDEVRYLRAAYPSVPVVVTGAMLTAPALVELLRLDVADALPKPFSPVELRDAVARAAARAVVHHGEALDYAAAVTAARRHLAAHDPASAARSLLRASRCLALDAEVTALEALRAELEGRDHDAGRGYRAALALGDDEAGEGPHPHEAIARLAAYGDARPVDALDARFADAPLWIVTDPPRELAEGPPEGTAGPVVVVMALSLAGEGAAVYLRAAGDRAFALDPQVPGAEIPVAHVLTPELSGLEAVLSA